jgi:hypothetical protein
MRAAIATIAFVSRTGVEMVGRRSAATVTDAQRERVTPRSLRTWRE